MIKAWDSLPLPGLAPLTDPAEEAAPPPSPDGHWWWDGQEWTPLVEAADQVG